MQKITAFVGTLTLSLLLFGSSSHAYETIVVKNGGTIDGVAEYAGEAVPEDKMLPLSSETTYCGESIPENKYLIKNRKIQNVVVSVSGIKAGKPVPEQTITVSNLKCAFVPRISEGFAGSRLTVKNDDPILHTFDVHGSLSGAEIYHVSLAGAGSSATKTLRKAGLMELSCYVHPWQHAFIYVFDHPYAAISDENGRFHIADIPPGTYAVEAWHEGLGIRKIDAVRVEGGKTTAVKVSYTKHVELY